MASVCSSFSWTETSLTTASVDTNQSRRRTFPSADHSMLEDWVKSTCYFVTICSICALCSWREVRRGLLARTCACEHAVDGVCPVFCCSDQEDGREELSSAGFSGIGQGQNTMHLCSFFKAMSRTVGAIVEDAVRDFLNTFASDVDVDIWGQVEMLGMLSV